MANDEEVDLEKAVGRRIRRMREQRSMSQAELGRLAKFGEARQSTMAKLEAGQRPLRLNEVAAIAEVLRVPISVLLDETPEQERARAARAVADTRSALEGALLAQQEAEAALDRARRSVTRLQVRLQADELNLRQVEQRERTQHFEAIETEVELAQQRWLAEQGKAARDGEHRQET